MALDADDLASPPSKKTAQKDLSPMSVGELQAYIGELEAEIGRARAAIAVKDAHRLAAAAFFKA